MRVVRVLPDVPAIDKAFDYSVPDQMSGDVRVGTMVRIALHGRRVGGWVVEDSVQPPAGVRLLPVAKVTGWGPDAELIELARWAAWRWAGRPASLLATASPPFAVRILPPPAPPALGPPSASGPVAELARHAIDAGGVSVLRIPPATNALPAVMASLASGPVLVVLPSVTGASRLAGLLRRAGQSVALVPRDWARAAAGGATIVGPRSAVWAPAPGIRAIVVLDAHDEGHRQEQAPTWDAPTVAAERARRLGIPCLLVSAAPPLQLLAHGRLLTLARAGERSGWPPLDVVDMRREDPRVGLLSERLTAAAVRAERAVFVINRKGRSRLLACAACSDLARCEKCGGALVQPEESLRCTRCGHERPPVCAACGGQSFRNLRPGLTRLSRDLSALLSQPVTEVTGDSDEVPAEGHLIGTEAVLHRAGRADLVAFLDFDQELLAPRFLAAEQALSLLARAARLTAGREAGRLLIQTRVPDHAAVQSALLADPARLAAAEEPVRRSAGLPPAVALAAVSGPAAEAFVGGLDGVDRLGPDEGRWLLRAADHQTLCDRLQAATRPPGRLRVEVDPQRI